MTRSSVRPLGLTPLLLCAPALGQLSMDAGQPSRTGPGQALPSGTVEFDQDVTNAVIFGSGNDNGAFTTARAAGVEVGLRGKLRFDDAGFPQNEFGSGADGTYTFSVGAAVGGAGWVAATTPVWNFEWSVNTDFDGSTGATLDGLTYEIGIDFDPTAGTSYLAFDPIDPSVSPSGFWDHAVGTNATGSGGGASGTDAATYAALIAGNNLAQNSWNAEFFNEGPFATFDPTVEGLYQVYFSARDAGGLEIARTEITIRAVRDLEFDQNVTNEVIFGSGNANGGFTTDRASGVELGLRNKERFPAANNFRSNGDGTYTYPSGQAAGQGPLVPVWSFEWSVNSDVDDTAGRSIDSLNYELGIDYDPSAETNFLRFDPIAINSEIPYTPPALIPFWDHAIGNNTTPNGGGASASDQATYATLIGGNNLVQNSWRMDFFDNAPFDAFDPAETGQYDFYLAAFDGDVEVARTSITTFVLDGATLLLEAPLCQADTDATTPGIQVEYQLTMRNLGTSVNGYQSFLSFDSSALSFESGLSTYTNDPFDTHITPMVAAEVAPGSLQLDGNAFVLPPSSDDALLATLVFTVGTECTANAVGFDLAQPFQSELSFNGSPLVTSLVDSPAVLADDTAPVIAPLMDMVVAADAGVDGSCSSAVVNYAAPVVTDTCTSFSVVCTPASGTAFPVGTTTVTCVAEDECGNISTESFDVTVAPTNLLTIEVELVGVSEEITRCLHFVTDNCSFVDVPLSFTDHDSSPATPVRAVATVEIPCGDTLTVCVKDEQHTQWDTTAVTIMGAGYVATSLVSLEGGDTDNDGDVDINDVTLLIAQFGNLAASGGCGWDGTRDADFDNDGAVGSSDYGFLTANWLTTSSCACTLPATGGPANVGGIGGALSRVGASSALGRRADLNGDGWVDVLDVRILEARMRLSGDLSQAMLGR